MMATGFCNQFHNYKDRLNSLVVLGPIHTALMTSFNSPSPEPPSVEIKGVSGDGGVKKRGPTGLSGPGLATAVASPQQPLSIHHARHQFLPFLDTKKYP